MHLHHFIFGSDALSFHFQTVFRVVTSHYVHFLRGPQKRGNLFFFVVPTLWSLLRARGTWTTRMSSHKRLKKIYPRFQFLWCFLPSLHTKSTSGIWRSLLFLRVFCSPTFINLTLASTGFSLRPQIQRGKIGWMLAKTVGSKRGRRQSPAHSEKISNVMESVHIS